MNHLFEQAADYCKTRGISEYDVFLAKSSEISLEARDQNIEKTNIAVDLAISVRIVENGKSGFSFSTAISEDPKRSREALEEIFEQARESAEIMPIDKDLTIAPTRKIPGMQNSAKPGADVEISQIKASAIDVERQVLVDPRIKRVRSAGLSKTESLKMFAASFGEVLKSESTLYRGWVTCSAEENGDAQFGGDSTHARNWNDLPLKDLVSRSIRSSTELLGAKPLPSGKYPTLLRSELIAELLDFISESFYLDNIYKKKSFLNGKLNEKLFSKQIQIKDDPLNQSGDSLRIFDGEGYATSATPLIQDGVLKNYLSDFYYSKKMGLPHTHNAVRGIQSPPMISSHQLVLEKGDRPVQTILAGLPKVVVLTELMGVHTANAITGAFSLGASGLYYENGKLIGPVKGFAVAGNIFELFRDAVEVANDFRFYGSIGCSSVLVSELSMSGS